MFRKPSHPVYTERFIFGWKHPVCPIASLLIWFHENSYGPIPDHCFTPMQSEPNMIFHCLQHLIESTNNSQARQGFCSSKCWGCQQNTAYLWHPALIKTLGYGVLKGPLLSTKPIHKKSIIKNFHVITETLILFFFLSLSGNPFYFKWQFIRMW